MRNTDKPSTPVTVEICQVKGDARGPHVLQHGASDIHYITLTQGEREARVYGSEEDLNDLLCQVLRPEAKAMVNGWLKTVNNMVSGGIRLEEYLESQMPPAYHKRLYGKDGAFYERNVSKLLRLTRNGTPELVHGERVLGFTTYHPQAPVPADLLLSAMPELMFTLEGGFTRLPNKTGKRPVK
jgi:hypothetical protein